MYHLKWTKSRDLWRMKLPSNFWDKWDILQYILSTSFVITNIYYGGLTLFIIHAMTGNFLYFFVSSADHDMYVNE